MVTVLDSNGKIPRRALSNKKCLLREIHTLICEECLCRSDIRYHRFTERKCFFLRIKVIDKWYICKTSRLLPLTYFDLLGRIIEPEVSILDVIFMENRT